MLRILNDPGSPALLSKLICPDRADATNTTLPASNLPLEGPPAKASAHETGLYVTSCAHRHFSDLTEMEASLADFRKCKGRLPSYVNKTNPKLTKCTISTTPRCATFAKET